MLTLSRRQNETVHIGHNITVEVISIRGSQVKLRFSAPKSVSIHRGEVYQRVVLENNIAHSKDHIKCKNHTPGQSGKQ